MVDAIEREKMAGSYGFALAFLQSDPELWGLFNKAVKNTWQPNLFVAKLRDTDWFKTHSANVRNAIMQQTSDPATYAANVNQMYATIRDTWGSMFGEAMMDKGQLRSWAETAHRMGWSEAQLVDRMTKNINYRKLMKRRSMGGVASQTELQLKSLEDAYGVKMGPAWRARQLERVIEGDDTIEGVSSRVREVAMREYKAWASEIAAGQTVQDIASPYMERMADLLELNPSEVTVMNNKIQAALKQTTKDGKPAAMDLNEFAKEVRKDKRWQSTNNAREEMSAITASVAQAFGGLA